MAWALKACALLFIIGNVSLAAAAPLRIIVLRHAEKVSDAERNLSPGGYARAQALANYFSDPSFLNIYGKPAAFFAASPRGDHSLRSMQTVAPAAKALQVPLDTSFGKGDGEELMESVLGDSRFDGKTVVICWNRKGIPDLLEPLKGEFPRHWSDQVFDRFWILELQTDGSYNLLSVPQNLEFSYSVIATQ